MRERDSGRALKRWIARKKAEGPTWTPKKRKSPSLFTLFALEDGNRDRYEHRAMEDKSREVSEMAREITEGRLDPISCVALGICAARSDDFQSYKANLMERLGKWMDAQEPQDPTWEAKVPSHPEIEHWTCKEAFREELNEQLRRESGPVDDYEGMEAFPPEDPEPSPWGWLLAILAGLAAWGALIVLLMCVWAAVKHG